MNGSPIPSTSIDRVLVVIDQEQLLGDQPEYSDLLQRAIELAQATGCELELFTACYELSLALNMFAGLKEVNQEKDRVINSATTRLGEIALEVKNRGVEVSQEVLWDHPYADACLRKIAEANPDLVMKQSSGPKYVLGLVENPDWELIRKSPAHVWFVKQDVPSIGTILTAIGETAGDKGIISESDYRVFEIGNMLASNIGARNVPVHSYEVPKLSAYATYAPTLVDATQVESQMESWDEIARMHGQAIQKFAEKFELDVGQVEIANGHPAEIIPEKVKSLNAGLVITSARNLGRWERLLSSVAAEPILSSVNCDVIFVKEADGLRTPVAEGEPRHGVPSVNIEMAIMKPDKTFESPESVVETEALTVDLRRRILEAWELDINRQLTAADEGGPVHGDDALAVTLAEINQAKESLARIDR